jgi:hypothetical protein
VTQTSDFSAPASEDRIQRAAAALRANNIGAIVVDTPADAQRAVFERIPDGAEVHTGSSQTLLTTGIQAALEASPKITWLRKDLLAMDRATQGRAIRKLAAAPDVMLGSVHALTEGLRRIREHSLKLENERLQKASGRDTFVSKILINFREALPGRGTAIIVREALGF